MFFYKVKEYYLVCILSEINIVELYLCDINVFFFFLEFSNF